MNLNGQVGEVRMTIEIKRKETGKVDTVEMVGFIDEEKLKELENERNTHNSGS